MPKEFWRKKRKVFDKTISFYRFKIVFINFKYHLMNTTRYKCL